MAKKDSKVVQAWSTYVVRCELFYQFTFDISFFGNHVGNHVWFGRRKLSKLLQAMHTD